MPRTGRLLFALPMLLSIDPVLAQSVLIDCQETKLRANDPGTDDLFGHAVDIDGDVAVVGSVLDDNSHGGDAGAVYVFERTGGIWTQTVKLEAPDGAGGDYFGQSVSIDGDTIAVGAYLDN